jgi:hypothetical protein
MPWLSTMPNNVMHVVGPRITKQADDAIGQRAEGFFLMETRVTGLCYDIEFGRVTSRLPSNCSFRPLDTSNVKVVVLRENETTRVLS